MFESLNSISVSTEAESKIRYMLVRWQPNSRASHETVTLRSLTTFLISSPIKIYIHLIYMCISPLPLKMQI